MTNICKNYILIHVYEVIYMYMYVPHKRHILCLPDSIWPWIILKINSRLLSFQLGVYIFYEPSHDMTKFIRNTYMKSYITYQFASRPLTLDDIWRSNQWHIQWSHWNFSEVYFISHEWNVMTWVYMKFIHRIIWPLSLPNELWPELLLVNILHELVRMVTSCNFMED